MSGWFPFEAQAWVDVADALPKPWPKSAVMMDLRWWADQERLGRRSRPGRAALAERWGWTPKTARRVMAEVESWADPRFGDPNPGLGKRRGPAEGQPRASRGPAEGQDSGRKCAEPLEARASEGPAEGQPRASEGPHARTTQAQAQAQTQHTGSSTQVDSPPAGAAGSDRGAGDGAEESKPERSKPTPTEQVRALWDTWEPVRVRVYGGKPGKLTAGRQRAMGARLREHSAEDVAVVLAWWLTSDHPRALYLRTQGYTWDTVLGSKFGSYLDLANSRPPQAATKPGGSTHSDSGSAEDVWQRLLRAIASGPAGLDGAPPEVLSALDVAGGYRELSQITHPADRARFRSRFIDAFERGAAA